MTTANALDQVRLLDVQALDTRLAQIAHRRRTLPEHVQLEQLQARAGSLRDELVTAQAAEQDLKREVAKAEQDVDLVRQRSQRNRTRLDAGTGTAKDLQALQHELVSLSNRQSDLEDVELEAMERLEEAQAAVARLDAERTEVEAQTSEVEGRLRSALDELDAEADKIQAERRGLAEGLDAGLTALYEKVRQASSGLGAAALKGRRCEGCRLELTPVELARIRSAPPDEVLRCEECGRILVRTADAGL